jgi:methanethiol S-methyltransferase
MKTLIIAWLLFFASHSVLAATPVKAYFEKSLSAQIYRLVYNLLSLLVMAWVLYPIVYGDKTLVFKCHIILCILGSILIFIGLYIMNAAFKHINIAAFLGLKSVKMESNGLNTEGVYAIVRHPLYWGISLVLVGLFIFMPYYSLLISMVMGILYMAIGIEFEEKKLRRDFGKAYEDYALGKKKFLPFLY